MDIALDRHKTVRLPALLGRGWFLQFSAVPRGEDYLGYNVSAQAQFLRYLLRSLALRIIKKRQLLLGLGPGMRRRARPGSRPVSRAGWPGGAFWAVRLGGDRRGCRRAELASPLIVELAGGQIVLGLLVK